MNFIQRGTGLNHNTFLQELALADGDRANGVNGLDTLADFFLKRPVKDGGLDLGVRALGSGSDDDLPAAGPHVLLHRGLHALCRNDERLHTHEVTVRCDHIDHVVNFTTVAANLPSGVVGLVVMADERGQGILTNALVNTEPEDHVHLGEVAVEFLLGHFVDTADDVFVGFTEGLTDFLEIPWMTRGTDCVPSLHLPLVTLLTCCCTCLCTDFLRHGVQLGSCLAGATPLASLRPTSPI